MFTIISFFMSVMPADQGLFESDYRLVHSSDYYGESESRAFIVASQDELASLWRGGIGGCCDDNLPSVDFDSSVAVIWFPGEMPFPGVSYEIEKVYLRCRGEFAASPVLFLVMKTLYRHGASDGTTLKPVYIIAVKKDPGYLPKRWWEKAAVCVEVKG
jgi:hypothetical protein